MAKEIPLNNRFAFFFDLLIQLEGGYKENATEKNTHTKWGISQAILNFYHPHLKLNDLNELIAKNIYENYYYNQIKPSKTTLNHYHYFDIAINNGIGSYKLCFLTTKDDTKSIINWRNKEYNDIVALDPKKSIFLKSWLDRVNKIKFNKLIKLI